MFRTVSSLVTLVITFTLLTGCSLKYAIDPPIPSKFTYQNVPAKPMTMKVVDRREDSVFSPGISGLKRASIVLENVEDSTGWLSREMEKEFTARGVPMKVTQSADAADMTLTVKKFQVVNHRASGFSAWESYHLFQGELAIGDRKSTITAFFFNSKVPVWSMNEVREPCLSTPLSIIVKDVVSQINKFAFNYAASDEDVKKMESFALANVKPDTEFACFPSIELGATNNASAMKTLQKIAESDDSFVRSCAISAIGTLGAEKDFDYLYSTFFRVSNNDKIIPIKSIGDIGGKRSADFLKDIKTNTLYLDENGVRYCVDLYMNR